MTVDVEGLRGTIRDLKQQIAGLQGDVVRLEQIADSAAEVESPIGVSAVIDLNVPSGIVVSRPDAVVKYLRTRSDTVDVVLALAIALADEFKDERHDDRTQR